jgi:hypothetical protein
MRPRHICFGINKRAEADHQEKKKKKKGKGKAFELVFKLKIVKIFGKWIIYC